MSSALSEFWNRAGIEGAVFGYADIHGRNYASWMTLMQMGLLRETELAESVICDNCMEGHYAIVLWTENVRSPSGRSPVIGCPEQGALDIEPERLRQWAVDMPRVANLLASALDLSGPVEPALADHRLWSLGRRHLAGRFREFFMVIGADGSDVPLVIERAGRISTAVSPVLLVPTQVPKWEGWAAGKLAAFSLASVSSVEGDRLCVDIEFIEDALPQERTAAKSKELRSQPVGEDTEWKHLHLAVGETVLSIRVNGSARELTVEALGFADRRKGAVVGDKVWQVLRLFAHHGGALALSDIAPKEADRQRLQKQIRILRKRLQTVFPIQGDPICCDRAADLYECAFRISRMTESGLTLGQGSSWLDVRIVEIPGGRIQFQVKTREVFAARRNGGNSTREREAAERAGCKSLAYSLETVGLAKSNGQLTDEGKALLALLRAGGRLNRVGDDMIMLRLGERLRRWTGLPDEPFQFSVAGGVWVARFECESKRIR
ncbi:MAG: hypothetical protein KJZ78_21250 [Bryobacteraceae bacterium]|nr:hypothetical protein [Bryobacteraceae bacterium]